MTHWTPDEVRRVLAAGEAGEARLNELAVYLLEAVIRGRAYLLRRKRWLTTAAGDKEDDAQHVVLALFDNEGRLLQKYGEYPGFRVTEHALQKYVIGVTFYVLQRKYQKYRADWEQIEVDLASGDEDPGSFAGFARYVRVIDVERAVKALSEEDQRLFDLLCVEQLKVDEICKELDITRNSLDQRKSRVLKRLREFLAGGEKP